MIRVRRLPVEQNDPADPVSRTSGPERAIFELWITFVWAKSLLYGPPIQNVLRGAPKCRGLVSYFAEYLNIEFLV